MSPVDAHGPEGGGDPPGGEETFDESYRRLLGPLLVWADLRIPASHRSLLAAEDVVQEVWFRALRSRDAFDPRRASFRSWLFGVAKIVLLDANRRLRRPDVVRRIRESGSSLLAVEHLPDEITALSRRIARGEAFRHLLEGLRGLDREERDLLVHCGLEGLPRERVAAMMGLGVAAVTKRWQRLRERLRETDLAAGLEELLAA